MDTIQPTIPLYDYLVRIYSEFKNPDSSARLLWLYNETINKEGDGTDDEYIDQLHHSFWRTVLLECNLKGRIGSPNYCLAADLGKLEDALTRPDLGKPVSLSPVVDDLKQSNQLISLDVFTTTYAPTPSWLERMYNSVTRAPTPWPDISTTITETLHVFMPTLEAIVSTILCQRKPFNPVDNVLTFTEFRALYAVHHDLRLTDPDLWLLLRYMNAKHGVAVDMDVRGYGRSHVAIKFPQYNESTTPTAALQEINQSDRAILSLKTTCRALHEQVDQLQLKMESLIKQSLNHSSKQQKPQALYALKRKHQLEQVLNRRLKSLETMETLLLQIEASHSDIQIIQAFNMGVDALKTIFNDNQLTVTSVDETMWRMQKTLEEQEQIENAMTNTSDPTQKQSHDAKISVTATNEKEPLGTVRLDPPVKRQHDDTQVPPDSELARLHSILSTIPPTPNEPPRSKQRRVRQLA